MTSQLDRKIEQASEHLAGEWSEEQIAFSHATFRKRLVRRQQMRSAAIGAACGAIVVVSGWGAFSLLEERPAAVVAKNKPPTAPVADQLTQAMTLADGTRIQPLDARSVVVVDHVSEKEVAVRLKEGGAQFDVTPSKVRVFLVRVDGLVVRVLGTSFTVRREPNVVRVKVSRGRVRVEWPGGASELGADERGVFPRLFVQEEPVTQPRARGKRARSVRQKRAEGAPRESAAETWQGLAEQGQYDAAYAALRNERRPVRNDAGDLLLAADSARLSGHPEEATGYLQRIVDHHIGDDRRPLAAFTLGGMCLRQLNDPLRAAALFVLVQEISPTGALASDALAREVEARSRAGDTGRAKELAREYLHLYPSGMRRRSVRRFGGIEQ